MIAELSDKNRRSLALGLLVIAVVVFFIVIVFPLQQLFNNYDSSIGELEFRLGKLQQTAQLQTSLTKQLEQLQDANNKSRDLINGESAALAGANLQELIKEVLRSTGNVLESSQMLPVVFEEDLQSIAIRIHFSSSVASLQKALYTLENNRPLLFVDELSIKISRSATQPSDIKRVVMLNVTLDIYGYRSLGAQKE
jgi:general secretion pathway protein M